MRQRASDVGFWPLLGAVMVLVFWQVFPTLRWSVANWNSTAVPSWSGTFPGDPALAGHARDIDTWFLHGGLIQAPEFRDTWRWWYGTWVGQVPFYRPITSLVLWVEWTICGDREARYTIFSIALHLLVVLQFARAAYTLCRSMGCRRPQWAMLGAGAIFVTGLFSFPLRPVTNTAVFALWKNQPDALCTLFFLLAVQAYARLTRVTAEVGLGGKQSPGADAGSELANQAHPRRWHLMLLSAGSFAMACLCKEAGALFPLLVIVFEWPRIVARQAEIRVRALKRASCIFAVLAGYLVVRTMVLRQIVGFRYGDNSDWGLRLFNELFGPLGRFTNWQHPPVLLWGSAAAGAVLWYLWRRGRARAGSPGLDLAVGMSVTVVVAVGLAVALLGGNIAYADNPSRNILGPASAISATIGVGLFLVSVALAIYYCRRIAVFGWAWVCVTLVFPLLTPSVKPFVINGVRYSHFTDPHRYYIVEGGFALMMGAGLSLLDRVRQRENPQNAIDPALAVAPPSEGETGNTVGEHVATGLG